jgi:hypothetical protein
MSSSRNEPGVYHFRLEEQPLAEAFELAVRRLLERKDLTAHEVHLCGVLLHAIQRLPRITPGIGIGLAMRKDEDAYGHWVALTINEERVELEVGETFRGDFGSDNESRSVFLVTGDGQDSANDLDAAIGYASHLVGLTETPDCRAFLEDFGNALPDWDDEGDPEWWNELPDWDDEPETDE